MVHNIFNTNLEVTNAREIYKHDRKYTETYFSFKTLKIMSVSLIEKFSTDNISFIIGQCNNSMLIVITTCSKLKFYLSFNT